MGTRGDLPLPLPLPVDVDMGAKPTTQQTSRQTMHHRYTVTATFRQTQELAVCIKKLKVR